MIANAQELGRHKEKPSPDQEVPPPAGLLTGPIGRPVTVLELAPRAAGTGAIP